MMQKSPGSMHLRTLQTIDGLGSSSSNTVLLFPAELSEIVKSIGGAINKDSGGVRS